jgi:polyisoprenoid-binding protein YceI
MVRSILISALAFGLYASNSFAAPLAADGKYTLDPDHTSIGFEVSHMGVSFVVGRFDKKTGTVQLAANGNTQIAVQIDPSSVDTNVAQRDTHLRTADFFNVSQFPTAGFVSTAVTYDNNGNPATVTGNLTLHGVTKPVVLTVTPIGTAVDQLNATRVGFHATAAIKRSEFGMTNLLALAGDNITLTMNIEAIKQ